MPITIRPFETSCSVAYQLAVTVGSRIPGFVTQWPSLIVSRLRRRRARAAGSDSCQRTCESYVQPYSKPLLLGELDQLDEARVRRIGQDGDAEAQHVLLLPGRWQGNEHTAPKSRAANGARRSSSLAVRRPAAALPRRRPGSNARLATFGSAGRFARSIDLVRGRARSSCSCVALLVTRGVARTTERLGAGARGGRGSAARSAPGYVASTVAAAPRARRAERCSPAVIFGQLRLPRWSLDHYGVLYRRATASRRRGSRSPGVASLRRATGRRRPVRLGCLAGGDAGDRLRRQAVERLHRQLEVLLASCPRASCARGRAGSGRRASPSGCRRARPRRRRAAGRRQPVRRAGDLADRLVGELDQRLVEQDRLDAPDPLPLDLDVLLRRRSARDAASRVAEHRARAASASRWRWSSSCSAVSTTEVTMPGLRDDAARSCRPRRRRPRAAISRISSASFAAPASASRRLSIGVEPACAAWPRQVIWWRSTPNVPSTTPSGRSSDSSTGPCSMCSSRYAAAFSSCERASSARSRSTPCSRSASGSAIAVARRVSCAQLVLVAHRAGRPPTSRRASGRSARPPRRPS